MLALAMQFFLSLCTKWNYDLASNLSIFAFTFVIKLVRCGKSGAEHPSHGVKGAFWMFPSPYNINLFCNLFFVI